MKIIFSIANYFLWQNALNTAWIYFSCWIMSKMITKWGIEFLSTKVVAGIQETTEDVSEIRHKAGPGCFALDTP